MNRAMRRRNKGGEPIHIETAQHKRFVKFLPLLFSVLVLVIAAFIGLVLFYSQFYHNELGKVKLVGSDGSVMYVEEDGTFKWYRAKWEKDAVFDPNSDYLAGVLRYYTGDSAYKVIDKNSQHFWNFTSDDIDSMYDEEYQKEDMFIMIIKGSYFKEDDTVTKFVKDNTAYVKYYLGFRQKDGKTLQLMEHDAVNMFQFTLEDYDL